MRTLIKLLVLVIGIHYTIMPMDYCSRTNSSVNECGIWEAQLITFGLTASAFACCTWFIVKSCNRIDQKKLSHKIKQSKKTSYPVKAAHGTTKNFKRR